MKRNILTLLAGLLIAGPLFAQLITDDFNRANTGNQTDGSVIGPGWNILSSQWRVFDNMLQNTVNDFSGFQIIINEGLQSRSADGYSFTLSGTAYQHGAEQSIQRRSGLVFHATDLDNYYVVWQRFLSTTEDQGHIVFAKVVDGSYSVIGASSANLAFGLDNLTLTVSTVAETPNTFTIAGSVGSTEVFNQSFVDSTFTSGYAGFWKNANVTTRHDDFSLNVIPEPATYAAFFGLLAATLVFLRRRRS